MSNQIPDRPGRVSANIRSMLCYRWFGARYSANNGQRDAESERQRDEHMKFGWLTLNHSPSAAEDGVAIDEQLQQACLAEALGYDSVWLTEHNFTGESVYGDPIPFASALAMKTERIRIGFAVIQMALRHPVRVATQLSVVDNLCKGRLDVGVGRGTIFNEYEFVGYGLDSSDSRERFAESLEIMQRAWTKAPFDYQGKYYKLSIPELRPMPHQRPHPPIWHSAISPSSFEHCGRQGVPVMTVRLGDGVLKERLGLYEVALRESGLSEQRQAELRKDAAVWRYVHVAESDAQAEDELVDALRHTRQHMVHARQTLNPPDFKVEDQFLNPWSDGRVDEEEALKFTLSTGAFYGTAKRVKEQLAALRDIDVHHVLCQMSFGFMSHARITQSMKLFGEQVIPPLR